jgi:hypothetical protein
MGSSDPNALDVYAWGDRPHPNQEVVDTMFALKHDTASDAKDGPAPSGFLDVRAMAAVKDDMQNVSVPASMASYHEELVTSSPGSPYDNLVEQRAITTTEAPEQPAGHDISDADDRYDNRLAVSFSMLKMGTDQLNAPDPSVDDTSTATQESDKSGFTSMALNKGINHQPVSPKNPVNDISAEKPTDMDEADWLKKLHSAVAPDYDGEWEDSPSRGPHLMPKNTLMDDSVAEPVTTTANTSKSHLASTGTLNHGFVEPTVKTLEETLAYDLEEIELGSPIKKSTKKCSVAADANKENGMDGFTKATLHKHDPKTLRRPLAPKTPKILVPGTQKTAAAAKSDTCPKLRTPGGASPMPTYSQVKAQANHNLKGVEKIVSRAKAAIDNDENLIEGEYADVSLDMMDYSMGNCSRKDYPTYHFPGTYEAVKHDTYEAAKNISTAAATFGTALGMAGVGKAMYSVGSLAAKGARRTGTVVGANATMGAIKLGYKESLPERVTQWAEETSYNGDRKAEKKKPVYKLAGVDYKKGDPRNYVLDRNPSAVQQHMIEFEDDLDEDDWMGVTVNEDAALPPPRRIHGEQAPVDYQDESRDSVYESFMTALESTSMVAARVGRNVSRGVRTVVGARHGSLEQRKIYDAWPKNLAELEFVNKVERRETMENLYNPNFAKVRDDRGRLVGPRPKVTESDEIPFNSEIMHGSEDEMGGE